MQDHTFPGCSSGIIQPRAVRRLCWGSALQVSALSKLEMLFSTKPECVWHQMFVLPHTQHSPLLSPGNVSKGATAAFVWREALLTSTAKPCHKRWWSTGNSTHWVSNSKSSLQTGKHHLDNPCLKDLSPCIWVSQAPNSRWTQLQRTPNKSEEQITHPDSPIFYFLYLYPNNQLAHKKTIIQHSSCTAKKQISGSRLPQLD